MDAIRRGAFKGAPRGTQCAQKQRAVWQDRRAKAEIPPGHPLNMGRIVVVLCGAIVGFMSNGPPDQIGLDAVAERALLGVGFEQIVQLVIESSQSSSEHRGCKGVPRMLAGDEVLHALVYGLRKRRHCA